MKFDSYITTTTSIIINITIIIITVIIVFNSTVNSNNRSSYTTIKQIKTCRPTPRPTRIGKDRAVAITLIMSVISDLFRVKLLQNFKSPSPSRNSSTEDQNSGINFTNRPKVEKQPEIPVNFFSLIMYNNILLV